MLILTRNKEESVKLITTEAIPAGTEIADVKIIGIGDIAVRLGFTAPQFVRVLRSELLTPTEQPANGDTQTDSRSDANRRNEEGGNAIQRRLRSVRERKQAADRD